MIRLASQAEAIEILREPQTVARLDMHPEELVEQPWIAQQGEHRLMFVFWEIGKQIYEMHIAAPKDSILSCRKLAVEAMTWLFDMGAEKIVTDCPSGKIANMAKRLGMRFTHEANGKEYYEVMRWELVQQ